MSSAWQSVIGREFQLDVAGNGARLDQDEELEEAIEEASAARHHRRAIRCRNDGHISVQPCVFSQTLYDEIVAPRRIRLHQQVARAVEDVHRARLDEHAAELAEHYAFSSDTLGPGQGSPIRGARGKTRDDVFAYGEAARHLERALVVQELADPEDGAKRCDLLLALGEALLLAGEPGRVIAYVAPDALSLAQALGDRRRAFRACSRCIGVFRRSRCSHEYTLAGVSSMGRAGAWLRQS